MRWVETKKKTDKIDKDKTHEVGRDKANLTLCESD